MTAAGDERGERRARAGRRPSRARWRRPVLVVALAVVLAFCLSQPAPARTPTDELREIFAEASRILTDPATEDRPVERLEAVLEIVDHVFAFRQAAELALGQAWHARNSREREEFVALFAGFVERSFVLTVAAKAKLAGGIELRYRTESIASGLATVRAVMIARDGNELPVEFRMVKRDDRWAIRDIVLDSVSFIGTYRAQFNRIVRASSYEDLVARMRAKALDLPDWWPTARHNDAGLARAEPRPPLPAPRQPEPPIPVAASPIPPLPATATTPPSSPDTAGVAASVLTPSWPTSTAGDSPSTPEGFVVTSVAPTSPVEARHVAQSGMPAAFRSPMTYGAGANERATAPGARRPELTEEAPQVAYWIQVGVFSHPEAASRQLEDLLQRALPVEIGPVDRNAGRPDVRWTRVRVGPFTDPTTAAATLRELERCGYAPFLATEASTPLGTHRSSPERDRDR